jgi:hypothetical protein
VGVRDHVLEHVGEPIAVHAGDGAVGVADAHGHAIEPGALQHRDVVRGAGVGRHDERAHGVLAGRITEGYVPLDAVAVGGERLGDVLGDRHAVVGADLGRHVEPDGVVVPVEGGVGDAEGPVRRRVEDTGLRRGLRHRSRDRGAVAHGDAAGPPPRTDHEHRHQGRDDRGDRHQRQAPCSDHLGHGARG